MPTRSRSVSVLVAACLAAACSSSGGDSPPPPDYVDPRATPVVCPHPPVLVTGGLNPAPDPAGVCQKPVQTSALPAVAPAAPYGWIDLGEHVVGDVIEVDVPSGAASLTLLEQAVSAIDSVTVIGGATSLTQANAAVIDELRDPAGALVYTDLVLGAPSDGSGAALFFDSPSPVTGSFIYPNSSAGLTAIGTAGVAPGKWHFTVNDYARECWLTTQPSPPPGLSGISCTAPSSDNTGVYRIFALTKAAAAAGSPSAIPETATLDVAIHIVDSPAPAPYFKIDSTTALADAHVRRMVESYAALLAGGGICLGTVTFYDAPDWARTRFATGVSDGDVNACDNLYQLFTLSIPGSRTVDLFLVPQIRPSGGGLGKVIGIDGSIPGPATVNGTVKSGAAVSGTDLLAGSCPATGAPLSLLTCGPDLVAYVAAHETGHFLGLYHTSEATGGAFDPLNDTPHCECSAACGVTSTDCSFGLGPDRCVQRRADCSGGQNLLFWAVQSATSIGFLSPQQGRVVRASPVVSHP